MIKTSWYTQVADYFYAHLDKYQISSKFQKEYHQFWGQKSPQRSITFRRLRVSYDSNYIVDPENPPIVWSLWSEWLDPKLFGYFEEIHLYPTPEELDFTLKIFKFWLFENNAISSIMKLSRGHPRFFESLPSSRRRVRSQLMSEIPRLPDYCRDFI